jgi:outer membrane immunogenic protein
MKRILLASVAALGLAGTASAADLAVRAPVVYAPVFTWTGCYLGVNGGWIGSDESYRSHYDTWLAPTAADLAVIADTNNSYGPQDSAGTVGGQFGCQSQIGNWVIGGEWDWNYSGLTEDNLWVWNDPNNFFANVNSFTQRTHKEFDWFSTVRARLGLAWDRVLVYATGGFAYAAFDAYTQVDWLDAANFLIANQFAGSYRERRIGYTVGGGLEWAFANNWTAKAEFLYLDFGSFDYVSPDGGGNYWYTSVDTKEYVARIGINYLFHTGGLPVVARY